MLGVLEMCFLAVKMLIQQKEKKSMKHLNGLMSDVYVVAQQVQNGIKDNDYYYMIKKI